MSDELRIERMVERKIDSLDYKLWAGNINQDEYNLAYDAICKWADDQYSSALASTLVVKFPTR